MAEDKLYQIVREVDIAYQWVGVNRSPGELQETAVPKGMAVIKNGLLLRDNNFMGISVDSLECAVHRGKALMQGKLDVANGTLLLRKDYLLNDGDVRSYLYEAHQTRPGIFEGTIWGASDEPGRLLEEGHGNYGPFSLKITRIVPIK